MKNDQEKISTFYDNLFFLITKTMQKFDFENYDFKRSLLFT
jgi:hypothetical protein